MKGTIEGVFIPVMDRPYALPAGWCWVYWGSLGTFTVGGRHARGDREGFRIRLPLYQRRDFDAVATDGKLRKDKATMTTRVRYEGTRAVVRERSVVFARAGRILESCGRYMNDSVCFLGSNLVAFTPNACLPEYVYWWSLTQDFARYASVGRVVSVLLTAGLAKVPFPLPPREEQQRIINLAREVFERTKDVEGKLNRIWLAFSEYRNRLERQMFHLDTVADTYCCAISEANQRDLKEVVSLERGQRIPRQALLSRGGGNRIRYLRPVDYDAGDGGEYYFEKENVGDGVFVTSDDIVMVCSGSNAGKIVGGLEGMIDASLLLVRPIGVHPDYLRGFLGSGLVQKFLRERTCSKCHPGLSLGDVNQLKIFVPSYEKQMLFLRVLRNLNEAEDDVRRMTQSVYKSLQVFRGNFLTNIFHGAYSTGHAEDGEASEQLHRWLKETEGLPAISQYSFIPVEIRRRLRSLSEQRILQRFFTLGVAALGLNDLLDLDQSKREILDSLNNLVHRGILVRKDGLYWVHGVI